MEYRGISLVTGAGGFIGRHLVTLLLEHGVRVRAMAMPHEPMDDLVQQGVEVVRADLTQPATLAPLFGGGVDRVFHCAAICNLSTPYGVLRRVNVDGVERITALALAAGVRSFVHLSSTSVYGPFRGVPFVEDAARHPQDSYGRSKRDGEAVVWQRASEGLRVTVLRPCTVYGPGCTDGAGKVFSRPTSLGAVPGSGAQRLSNVRVEDVAGAALYLSTREDACGQAFNIADDSHPPIEAALGMAAEAFGARRPRLHLPLSVIAAVARVQALFAKPAGRIPDLELDAVRYLAGDYLVDNSRLKAAGYALRYPDFAESMRDMRRRYREQAA